MNDVVIPADQSDGTPARRDDPRLSEARRLLEELKEAQGTDALAPARRLVEVLEDLLEGREEAQS